MMLNSRLRLVSTWTAVITGVGAILLPFAYSTSPRDATFDGEFWQVAVPFYLALPIGLAALRRRRTGLASAGLRVGGWIGAVASGSVTTYFIVSGVLRGLVSQPREWFIPVLLGVCAAGAALVLRRGRGRRSIQVMQVAYVANAQWCLLGFAGQWQSGAWCALITVVIYVVQIVSEITPKDRAAAPESDGRPPRAAVASAALFVMSIAAAALIASGCAASPTESQPLPSEAVGTWEGTLRLYDVWAANGGGCLLAFPQFTVGMTSPLTLQVAATGEVQSGYFSPESGVSAKLANLSTGVSCELHGWSITPRYATLQSTTCDTRTVRCDNGDVRDLRAYVGEGRARALTLAFSVTGNSATGGGTEVWEVFIPGTDTPTDRLVLRSDLSLTRR